MYIENEFKKIVETDNVSEYRDGCINFLAVIVEKFIEDKKLFTIDNFRAYAYDEYVVNTPCTKDIFHTIYLEINQPANYKTSLKKAKPSDKLTFPTLYFGLDKITEELYNLSIQNLDNNNVIWHDYTALYIKSTYLISDSETHNVYYKIIPCLTYHNKNKKQGVMYKLSGGIEIEYPLLSIDNFIKKNKKTKDVYRQTVVVLKNIILKETQTDKLPKEIIEIMLYNAPNELFKNTTKDNLLGLINYLRNYNVKSFKTIDEQDLAFTSRYRSMSPIYVKHILKVIEKYLMSN